MRQLAVSCIALFLVATAASFAADPPKADNPPHLRQRNPAKVAPNTINAPDPAGSPIWDAYPWFNRDGKLLFWTREQNGVAHVFVTYLRNRGEILNEAPGAALPGLDVSTPMQLPGSWNHGTQLNQTVKAIAFCHQDFRDNTRNGQPHPSFKEYTFTMFYSSGEQGKRKLWRIPNLRITLNKNTKEIAEMEAPDPHVPLGSSVNLPGRNATEPMLTRDGRFLFWASNASTFSPQARYIEVSAACTQLDQPVTQYQFLPANRFAWVDQYTNGADWDRTRTTNYHTVLEKGPVNSSQTALIFERCTEVERRFCDQAPLGTSRYCDCVSKDDRSVPLRNRFGVLMSTGFAAGAEPAPILGCFSPKLNQEFGGRDTHPAISGPPTQGGTWLMFFMRGKKIWYTNIGECPATGECTCT